MDGILGEIRLFGGNFAPRNWAFCDGQLIHVAQNTALFSIIGTIYGGDGRTTFALPNLQGRVAMGDGRGPGLSSRRLGEVGGAPEVTLRATEIPAHSHNLQALAGDGEATDPTNAFLAEAGDDIYAAQANATMAPTGNTGGNNGHENRQPFLVTQYIICTAGQYPSRS